MLYKIKLDWLEHINRGFCFHTVGDGHNGDHGEQDFSTLSTLSTIVIGIKKKRI